MSNVGNFTALNYPIIGIAGAAKSGKDTLCSSLIREFSNINIPAMRKSIAGDIIKKDLHDLILNKFTINSFTKNSKEKEFIRPLLVEYGKLQRKKTQGRYFIELLNANINSHVTIIPDIRYMEYSKDEVFWLKDEMKGLLIFIERKNVLDVNETEKINNKLIKEKADYILKWDTLDQNNPKDLLIIDSYSKYIINEYYIPMIYSATICQ